MGSRAIAVSPDGKQRLRRLLEKRRDRDLHAATRADGALTQPKGHGRMHRRQRRRAAAPRRSGSTARTRSRSAPTAATSTRPRGRATRSPSSTATRRRGRCAAAAGAAGCISGLPVPVCAARPRPWSGPTSSSSAPTASNVYVGSFFGNAVAVFDRDPGQRRADPARRQHRLHRRSDRRLRHRHRPGRARGDGDQRRRGQRLRRRRPLQRRRRAGPRSLDRRPDPGRPTAAAASSTARWPAARPESS